MVTHILRRIKSESYLEYTPVTKPNKHTTESTKQWIQKTLHRDLRVMPTLEECKAELRKAQRSLRSVKKRAQELRLEFLLQTIDDATAESETAREKAIRNIIHSQEKIQSFTRIRQIFKPTRQGGLSHILIPADNNSKNEWQTVTQPERIQELLNYRNIHHFGMAQGTPFTQEPLTRLNWEADSLEAEQLIGGDLPEAFNNLGNEHVTKLIHHIRDMPQIPEIECQLTMEEVSNGFQKWREATLTSPSGCHLGLRCITTS
jgi:hypothetical protein